MSINVAESSHAPSLSTRRRWLTLVALMLPVLLVSIDNTVLSFAVPALSRDLQPTATQLLWIVDIYPLVLAGLLVTMGTLGDRLGRRRLLLIGATGFGVVSVWAAFSADASHLIAARAAMGIFGATLMPATLALLRNVFTDDGERRFAIAVWAAGFSGGAALGPIVGGWLLEHFWWGSVFLLNVPVLVIFLIAAPQLVPESRGSRAGRFDLVSVALSILAMVPLVYAVKTVAHDGLVPMALVLLAVAATAGWLFVRRQLHRPDPLLDVRLFQRPVFAASVAANLVAALGMAGLLFLLAQYLQLVLGLSPMVAGLWLLPGLVGTVALGLLAAAVADRAPLHVLVPIGIGVSALGYAVGTTLTGHSGIGVAVAVFVLVGAGSGFTETLTNDAILAAVPPARAGAASSISETAYELGSAFGVAILGSVASAIYRDRVALPETIAAGDRATASETLGGAVEVAGAQGDPGVGAALLDSAREAFASGLAVTAAAGVALLAVTAVWVGLALRRGARRDDAERAQPLRPLDPAGTTDPEDATRVLTSGAR
ncbi:MFS transporter [Occultella aeris]|uniref:Antiseptic resistance protein n=2 Tax=Occultella aeris TaxID=2761496 RepID=A0A7M4DEA2_9MICO|nr:MFS transporter [Occultella aeris]VZO35216.1 Antiseptic resistance protein [Occultella aeris]